MPDRLGFIGLGIMGSGMAANLLRNGNVVTVFNRNAAKAAALAERGATIADSARLVGESADIVFICVSDTPDVESVLFGGPGGGADDSLLAGLSPGNLVVDMSTVSPVVTIQWSRRLREHGIAFIDAPVSGGSEGAAAGTLSIMVGGSEADMARARPYLAAIGTTITHIGDVGAGQTCKLANQILVVVNMLAAAEALVFARAGGLNLGKVIAAIKGGAGGSWMFANRGPQVIARDWRPGFTIDLQQKDLRLVQEAAREFGAPVATTAVVSQLYTCLQHEGGGSEGNHALVKALEQLSGITAKSSDGAA
jgi:3-hydroxyisobutyrate dehydrogenase-like beta-hydroxyacid dehydrogenase